jgi:hypothetical protein
MLRRYFGVRQVISSRKGEEMIARSAYIVIGAVAAGIVLVLTGWSSAASSPRLVVQVVNDPTLSMGPTVHVRCPTGWVAVGGGTRSGGGIVVSYAYTNKQPRDWYVQSVERGSVTPYVVCARVR